MAGCSTVDFNVGVVLPAAGCGERMKLPTPKQFCELLGRPLISYTVDCFHRHSWVKQIVISTSKEHVDLLRDLVDKTGFSRVSVVEGGTTRHRSIHAALKYLQQACADLDVVVIHDAVRPFLSSDILEKIVWAARKHGAAGVCRPLVSTVIARDEKRVMTESLDRRRYVASEMPQAFQTSVISAAYDQCTVDDFEYGTECLLLALKHVGVHATILDGDPDLWKVTYKKDLYAAEGLLKEQKMLVCLTGFENHQELSDALKTELKGNQLQHIRMGSDVNHQFPSSSGDQPSTVSSGANTFIYLHTDISSVGLKDKLTSLQSEYSAVSSKPQMFDFTYLHIFLAAKEEQVAEWHTTLSKVFLEQAQEQKSKSIQMFGVLSSVSQSPDQVSKMAVSILVRGHSTFSGQIYLV